MFRSPVQHTGIRGELEQEATNDVNSASLLSCPEKHSWVNHPWTIEKKNKRKKEITPPVLPSATSKPHQTCAHSASSTFFCHSGLDRLTLRSARGLCKSCSSPPLKGLHCKSTPAAGCVPSNARTSKNELWRTSAMCTAYRAVIAQAVSKMLSSSPRPLFPLRKDFVREVQHTNQTEA